MKKYLAITLAAVALTFTACGESTEKKAAATTSAVEASSAKAVSNAPVMTFDKTIHDFGNIQEGERVETLFTFTNTGKSDLVIVDARGSCGCTVPEYPKNTPIAPGASAQIRVSFDSSNKPNLQQKTVTISANTDSGRETIRIKAMVQADPVKEQQRQAAAAARLQQNN
ncbi:MAG: DUF1573 domain-containing protein [Flavobacteriaceae bacterium]|jgi:hypothetical protein|nr:DUF1573 domain-containing protein [Flavobacteriaceae bacterium]